MSIEAGLNVVGTILLKTRESARRPSYVSRQKDSDQRPPYLLIKISKWRLPLYRFYTTAQYFGERLVD